MTTRGLVVAAPRKYHGLGNRLRAVLGTRSLAWEHERDFAYTWPTGPAFGAHLTELWDFPARRMSAARSRLLALRYPYRGHDLSWIPDAASDRVWQVRTAHALSLPSDARPWGDVLRSLPPAPSVAERVDRLWRERLAGEGYVGVMVRSHPVSHQETLRHSPVSWFHGRMAEIQAARPGVRFFVSSDTATAQAELLAAFPSAVALDDKGAYNSSAAIRSSVVDLYLLASSGHILAPHYSSFPETALELAGPALRLETSRTDGSRTLRDGDPLTAVADPLTPHLRISA